MIDFENCPECGAECVIFLHEGVEAFICDECDDMYLSCPDCGEWTLESEYWDYKKGVCFNCASEEDPSGIFILILGDPNDSVLEEDY